MGEVEHPDREALADVSATVAAYRDPLACTVGADPADPGPAGLGAEHGGGQPAKFGRGAAAGDVAQQGPADVAAAAGAADWTGSRAGDRDAGATQSAESSFGPSADPAAATVDGRRDAGATAASGGGPPEAMALRAAPAIPGYEVLGELGRGGMGVVYQARQVRLNRPCALKMILAGAHAGAEAAARFLAEAEAVAKLQHPNIVQIFHIDEHAGHPYFEMEFVGGGSLATRLDGAPRPPREAARLVEALAGAMAEAHRRGVVHRDLKPANILLTPDGTPKVADFGLAKLVDVESGLTRTDTVLGSPSYMAPEQAEGKNKGIGPAADTYALGAVLYEQLVGRPPFRGATVLETLQQVKAADPVPPSRLVPRLPRDIETVCLKCLQKDPPRRYPSAEALAEDLRRFLAGEPIVARPVGPAARAWRWCRRNPVVAGLAAALALVFLAGFVGVAWKWREAERQKDIAQAAQGEEARQRAVAVAQAELATREMHLSLRLLYASDMNLAQRAWEAGTIGVAQAALERHVPQAGQEDLRGFEWRYLWQLCQDGSRRTLPAYQAAVTAVAFSPDGLTLVTAAEDHTVRLWDVASWRHVKLVVTRPSSAAFAPDGKTLALASEFAVRLWDVAARREHAVFSHDTLVAALDFSPDGKLLATGCWDQTVRVWDVATRRQVGTLRGHTQALRAVAFSRDGKVLASGGLDGTVRLWDATTLREVTTFRRHTALVRSLSFSPDRKTLASTGIDGTVQLYDVVTAQWRASLPGQRATVEPVTFSPDGKTLATGGGDGTIRVWDPETKTVVALLRGHTDPVMRLAYAPGGRTLVSGSYDGTVKVWDMTGKRDPSVLPDQKPAFHSVAFSPDGKTLAVGDEPNHRIKLWDTASRQQIATLEGGETGSVQCVAIAPDGQTVAAGCGDAVRLWDMRTKDPVKGLRHPSWIDAIAFSPDGKLLAACGGGAVQVWNRDTGRTAVERTTPGQAIRFSPDGTLLAIGSERTVRLWDVATWRELVVFRGHAQPVRSLAFAPGGRLLASGDWAGTLLLWDVIGQRQVLSRRVDAHVITTVAFSPNGRRLFTGGGEGRFWDVGVLQELAAMDGDDGPAARFAHERLWAAASVATLTGGHDGKVTCAAFAPDGDCLATGSLDATVRLWPAPPLTAAPAETVEAPSLPPTDTFRLFSMGLFGTAKATLAAEGGASRVDVTAVDGTVWHARLEQSFDDLQEGANYTVRFRAKADVPGTLKLFGLIGEYNYHGIGLDEIVSLARDWRDYEFKFRATDLAAKNMIQFLLGERTGTVWITDFTVVKITK